MQVRYREFTRRTGRSESKESVREFLHHEILRVLSARNPGPLVLHGGCKTRYVDGFARYSMDMDFSLHGLAKGTVPQREEAIHNALDPVLAELARQGIPLERSKERWQRGQTGVKLCFKANVLKELFPAVFVDSPGSVNFNINVDALYPGEQVATATLIADSALRIIVLSESSHMARKATAVLRRNQLRDLYDLDAYIRRGTRYDLDVVRTRLGEPDLTHDVLVERLRERIRGLDLKARSHQEHLPNMTEVEAFVVLEDRLAMIGQMSPVETL